MQDEGPGIDPGDIPRIFDRFYQADQTATRQHGGVGLGLHIVKGLAESMDGRVTVDSTLGIGVGLQRHHPDGLRGRTRRGGIPQRVGVPRIIMP